MSYKPIIIIAGEPNSVFLEIFFKSIKKKNYKSHLILISSMKVLRLHMRKLNYNFKINLINYENISSAKLNKKSINLIDIDYKSNKIFSKISKNSKPYIEKCFNVGLKIIKSGITNKVINGPISKKKFLNNKFLGITEYLTQKSNSKKSAMLIYNKKLSVCPITTHLPLKKVSKKITKKIIKEKILLIDDFYKTYEKISPKIAVVGLNPHCESVDKFNEDEKIIKPTIKYLQKLKFKISGPYSADTIFLSKNRRKFDVIVGMYHDQVLTPMKTIFEYDAINITLGLPFLRVSPDHGPNEKMIGKNLSNPLSLIQAINFLDKN